MSKITESRKSSFHIITLIYFVAFGVGFLTYRFLIPCLENSYWSLFWADVAATIVVWAYGLMYKNVSVYDPYWSVLPPVLLTFWAFHIGTFDLAGLLMLIAIWYWGIRLTGNWAYTFKNLDTEDWRYTQYRTQQKPLIFQIINFFGLNMMPTIVVFLAMLPALDLLTDCSLNNDSFSQIFYVANGCNWLFFVGFLVCIAAATIQLIADTQRHRFAKTHKGEVCNVGLWKHGRHPNYFGEIAMWWGVWLMYVSINGFERNLWYLAGPVAMTCLFLFISIPMMEKRQLQNKPDYAEYKKRTRIFI